MNICPKYYYPTLESRICRKNKLLAMCWLKPGPLSLTLDLKDVFDHMIILASHNHQVVYFSYNLDQSCLYFVLQLVNCLNFLYFSCLLVFLDTSNFTASSFRQKILFLGDDPKYCHINLKQYFINFRNKKVLLNRFEWFTKVIYFWGNIRARKKGALKQAPCTCSRFKIFNQTYCTERPEKRLRMFRGFC